jgi:predicted nucleic acid-binding protein
MYYVDTNAVLDYAFPNSRAKERHERAKKLIDETEGNCYISSFVVLELRCTANIQTTTGTAQHFLARLSMPIL